MDGGARLRQYVIWRRCSADAAAQLLRKEHSMENNNHSYHQNVMYQDGSGGGDSGGNRAMNALAAAAEARQSFQSSAQPQQQLTTPSPPPPEGKLVESGQENTGRWSHDEHEAFLLGLKLYGRKWKKVASVVRTRTVMQCRTHAQKYFQKLPKG